MIKTFKSVCALIALLLITFSLSACGTGVNDQESDHNTQKVTISATVVDINNEPVKDAEITIHSTPVYVTTDSQGFFQVTIDEGSHEIEITAGSKVIYSGSFSTDEHFYSDTINTNYNYQRGDSISIPDKRETQPEKTPEEKKIIFIEDISFNDTNLADCVDEHNAIYIDELTVLDCSRREISDLRGIAHLTALEELDLNKNRISNISELSSLKGLKVLRLGFNEITNLSPLDGLTELTELYLFGNRISDISMIKGLTSLLVLDMDSNMIEDITALSGMTDLEELWLNSNYIQDIRTLSSLTHLKELYLESNEIISGVADLTALTSPELIIIGSNPGIPCADLEAIESAFGYFVVDAGFPVACSP